MAKRGKHQRCNDPACGKGTYKNVDKCPTCGAPFDKNKFERWQKRQNNPGGKITNKIKNILKKLEGKNMWKKVLTVLLMVILLAAVVMLWSYLPTKGAIGILGLIGLCISLIGVFFLAINAFKESTNLKKVGNFGLFIGGAVLVFALLVGIFGNMIPKDSAVATATASASASAEATEAPAASAEATTTVPVEAPSTNVIKYGTGWNVDVTLPLNQFEVCDGDVEVNTTTEEIKGLKDVQEGKVFNTFYDIGGTDQCTLIVNISSKPINVYAEFGAGRDLLDKNGNLNNQLGYIVDKVWLRKDSTGKNDLFNEVRIVVIRDNGIKEYFYNRGDQIPSDLLNN